MSTDDVYIREQIIRDRMRDAIELARRLMANRKDWRGMDYDYHDVEVMLLLPPESTDVERKAALLHSVLDTGAATPETLLACGVEAEVIEIVKLVSNGPAVRGYAAYVQKCRDIVASGNRSAMKVKLADMLANEGHPTNNYAETIAIMRAGIAQAGAPTMDCLCCSQPGAPVRGGSVPGRWRTAARDPDIGQGLRLPNL